jgi:hypothetical protein
MFNIRFYDTQSKAGVSPSQVRVNLTDKNGDTTQITLLEISSDIGHYHGSFVPTVGGEWRASVVHGATPEVIAERKFYVSTPRAAS